MNRHYKTPVSRCAALLQDLRQAHEGPIVPIRRALLSAGFDEEVVDRVLREEEEQTA